MEGKQPCLGRSIKDSGFVWGVAQSPWILHLDDYPSVYRLSASVTTSLLAVSWQLPGEQQALGWKPKGA